MRPSSYTLKSKSKMNLKLPPNDADDRMRPQMSSYSAHTDNRQSFSEMGIISEDRNGEAQYDFEALRAEHIGTTRLPGLSDLFNIKTKASLISDADSRAHIINLTKYVQSLEHIIRFKNKEIQRLEYLNKYLVIAQQKRDEMLTHTLEENRKLKELAIRAEKKFTETRQRTQLSGDLASPSNSRSKMFSFTKSPSNVFGSETSRLPRKKSLSIAPSQGSTTGGRTAKHIDSKKSLSILKMNEGDAYSAYAENEDLRFLEGLTQEEDSFIHKIRSWEDKLLTSVYDSIKKTLNHDMLLFDLVFKLKRVIKATNTISQSLALNEAMDAIVTQICECLNCDNATIWLVDQEKEELWTKCSKGSSETLRIPWDKGLAGMTVQKKETLNILNAFTDERFKAESDIKSSYKINTMLSVPIFEEPIKGVPSNSRVLGVVQAINKRSSYFEKDDEGLLSYMAQFAGAITKNSFLFDEERLFHNNLRGTLNIGIYLNSLFGMNSLIPQAEKKLQSIMNVETCRIFIRDKMNNDLVRYDSQNQKERYPINSGIVGYVIQKGTFESTANAYSSPIFNGRIDIETSMPLITWPMTHPSNSNDIIGVIQVIYIRGIRGLAQNTKPKISITDNEALDFFSKQLAQAVINNLIYEELGLNLKDVGSLLELQMEMQRTKSLTNLDASKSHRKSRSELKNMAPIETD